MPRALLSVSDKTGLVDFAQTLITCGFELISTGGTAKLLRENGLPTRDLAEITEFPEMMDGRVKTLHPRVHGGLLYVRGNSEHEQQASTHGIEAIDLVLVNLYPFEETILKPGVSLAEAIENIDIGGPSMLRSAAKNHASVTALVDPLDYPLVAAELRVHGQTSPALRAALAAKVFTHTAYYDAVISLYLRQHTSLTSIQSPHFALPLKQRTPLRYGENPHQEGFLYGDFSRHFEQLHGKELSYNNLLDLSAAVQLNAEFSLQETPPTLSILKHTNPCGVGSGASLKEAWDHAYACDRQAPFGGIIIVNRPLDEATAAAIAEIFSEVIIAPAFTPEALSILTKKKNLRLILNRWSPSALPLPTVRSIAGNSYLLQDEDLAGVPETDWKIVTRRAPTAAEQAALRFGWRVVKHVKSNAIVYTSADRTLGIGAGQMSRVDSAKVAAWKASEAGLSLLGSVVASDAFFPFPDGLITAREAGATAVIQPGGSIRDPEVIAAADAHEMTMIFTGRRHFRH
jgi:phosphoribosylaminoimidazolecarboxamide formyltransferase / IMP cyclohydrolase